MNYSEEFKQRVLSLKKVNKELVMTLLSSDYPTSQLLGTLLVQYEGVSAKDIIYAIENNDFTKIYEDAKDKLIAEELYVEWMRDYYPQYQQELSVQLYGPSGYKGRKK